MQAQHCLQPAKRTPRCQQPVTVHAGLTSFIWSAGCAVAGWRSPPAAGGLALQTWSGCLVTAGCAQLQGLLACEELGPEQLPQPQPGSQLWQQVAWPAQQACATAG